MTRRGLLAASAAAVLAGCGKDESEPARASDALLRQLAAERAFAAATSVGRPLVERVSARASERAQRLAAALSAAGGRPHDAPLPGDADREPEEMLRRGRLALLAHVTALPSLRGGELRALGADLVAGAAADVAVLGDVLDLPVSDPFPGMTA